MPAFLTSRNNTSSFHFFYPLKINSVFCGCFSLAGKDGRGKKSRKQKLREINQKGDMKEGSEMDAFTDDKVRYKCE